MSSFTQENTDGYSTEQLTVLNDDLAAILAEIDEHDLDARERAGKAFSDEVAGR